SQTTPSGGRSSLEWAHPAVRGIALPTCTGYRPAVVGWGSVDAGNAVGLDRLVAGRLLGLLRRGLGLLQARGRPGRAARRRAAAGRSEEHTSELQSRENLVCRLLLEKKK